jgi:signal transduction histidine kinase
MMKMISRLTRKHLMKIPEILGMAAVAIAGLADLPELRNWITAAILLALFAIFLFSPFFWHGRALRVHVGLTLLSALTAGLMTLRPGWNFFPILFFLLAPVAMIYLPLTAGLVWIGLFILITGAAYVAINGVIGLVSLLPFAAGYVFFGVFGWITMESERNRARAEQLLADLQTAHQQLQEYAAQVEELTISQERNRIAREMHDTLGHRLTIASVQLEGAQRLIPTQPERAMSIIATVREQVKEALTELRRTVAMLRASVEEDLPLDKALSRLVDQVQQATALNIHLSLADCPAHLSLPQHQALYRATQEALTNIQRHALASEAWLQLTCQDNGIELLISDNGVGISPEQARSGFGLLGLQERAVLQGGEFHVDARPGGGTQITFRIPLVRGAYE